MAKYNYKMHLERNNEKKTHTFVVETPEEYRACHSVGEIDEIAVCQMPDWIVDESWEIADSEYTEAKLTASYLSIILYQEFLKGGVGEIDVELFQWAAQPESSPAATCTNDVRRILEAVVARVNQLV